jgi:ElaB/YqjD/DUF883 family membrane-anchored ribosome-binding protein
LLCFTAGEAAISYTGRSVVQDRERDIDKNPMAQADERLEQATQRGDRSGTQGREDMSQKATEFSERARERTEEGMHKAASSMDETAQKLRERTEGKEGIQAKAGEKTADAMEKTANYLREKDTQQIMDDVERYVKEHPVQAVAGAVVSGFILARILR